MNLNDFLPIIIVGAIIGVFSVVFVIAYALLKNKKEAIGFDRNMKDSEIVLRLLRYAKPYRRDFVLVFLIMAVSVAYDIVSPLLVGYIEELVKNDGFSLSHLYITVAIYGSILIISLICTYLQQGTCHSWRGVCDAGYMQRVS